MAVDDILTIKSQMTDDLMSTVGDSATYTPINPATPPFTLNVYLSRRPINLPNASDAYVLTTQKTIKFCRHDLPSGYTPERGDKISIPGKPVYIVTNKDPETFPRSYNFNRYLPRYLVMKYHTTTTTTTITTTTTTTAPP